MFKKEVQPGAVPYIRFRENLLSSGVASSSFSSKTKLTIDPFFMKALQDSSIFTGSEFWGMVENRPVLDHEMACVFGNDENLDLFDFFKGFDSSFKQLHQDNWSVQEIHNLFSGFSTREIPLVVLAELALGGEVNYVLTINKDLIIEFDKKARINV